MQVVVVGSGAREHALAWQLARSPQLTELHAAPGNPGIAELGRCHPVRALDADGLVALTTTLEADLVVIGPEPLREREAECELLVVPRRAHRDGDRLPVDADLERLLDGDDVGRGAVRDANDVDLRRRVRRCAHAASISAEAE